MADEMNVELQKNCDDQLDLQGTVYDFRGRYEPGSWPYY